MQILGRDTDSAGFWEKEAATYHDVINNQYHQRRLAMVRSLITPTVVTSVLDFGAGDGVMLADFPNARCTAIEPDKTLADAARASFPKANVIQGTVTAMADLPKWSVDLVLCLNVLAYMTDDECDAFYRESHRIMRPGAALVVTHSNELFDLFSLNAYTVNFFRSNFGCDVAPMLARPTEPKGAVTYNVRENPLTYATKLARYGFREERQGFHKFHSQPPLMGKDAELADTLAVPESERWKLMFQCSTFGSRSVKT